MIKISLIIPSFALAFLFANSLHAMEEDTDTSRNLPPLLSMEQDTNTAKTPHPLLSMYKQEIEEKENLIVAIEMKVKKEKFLLECKKDWYNKANIMLNGTLEEQLELRRREGI
ncbi:MAG TPA: hypothetical protein VMW10_12580 [Alphaproteobacteria bacterium]|nr:hypothetical protein [Alphaproteobacteria bacterium]